MSGTPWRPRAPAAVCSGWPMPWRASGAWPSTTMSMSAMSRPASARARTAPSWYSPTRSRSSRLVWNFDMPTPATAAGRGAALIGPPSRTSSSPATPRSLSAELGFGARPEDRDELALAGVPVRGMGHRHRSPGPDGERGVGHPLQPGGVDRVRDPQPSGGVEVHEPLRLGAESETEERHGQPVGRAVG